MIAETNIADAIARHARERPESLALVVPKGRGPDGKRTYETWTYARLEASVARVARGLVRCNINRGTRAALMVRPGPDFFALTFGMLRAGVVPVVIDPGIGRAMLGQCLAEAAPEAFVGISAAHAARLVLGWARKTIRTTVTVGRRWFWAAPRSLRSRRSGRPTTRRSRPSTATTPQRSSSPRAAPALRRASSTGTATSSRRPA